MAGIILRHFRMHLINESVVSINDCFSMRFEILTCPDKMNFINFEHCASYSRLLRFYSVTRALIEFPLNYATYIVV